jgi:hypothetical protein
MKQCSLAVLGSNWRRMSKSECRHKQYFPNVILWDPIDRRIAIEVTRSSRGSQFALNMNAVFKARQKEGWQCYIRFVEADGTYVGQDTLGNIFARVRNVNPNEGDFGAYWWIDTDGFASPPGGTSDCPI